MTYKEYIVSDGWYKMKAGILERRGCKCQKCGKEDKLDLHHLTYKRLFNELPQDLMLLCRDCHLAAHDIKINKSKKRRKKIGRSRVVKSKDDIQKLTKKLKYLYKKVAKFDSKYSRGVFEGDVYLVNKRFIVNQIKTLQNKLINNNVA